MEELTEKPRHVSVHVLSSTTALMSWTSSQENYNGTIVSVVSLTCQKQKESQRLEKQYCTQVKEGIGSPAAAQPRRQSGEATREAGLRSLVLSEPGQERGMSVHGSWVTVIFLFPLRVAASFLFHSSCRRIY